LAISLPNYGSFVISLVRAAASQSFRTGLLGDATLLGRFLPGS
jgi:hypothetical protein